MNSHTCITHSKLNKDMGLSSAFRERFEDMERTRNERLSLLQAEKDVQAVKSSVLASKFANIRSMERRCLILDQKIANQNFKISALHSEIECLDVKYQTGAQQIRQLKSEVEELEGVDNELERFYEEKTLEMKEFRLNVESFKVECRITVEKMKNCIKEHNSKLVELQTNNGDSNYTEIASAEMRNAELIAQKESLETTLASNYQIRSRLQNQLRMTSNQWRKVNGTVCTK